VVEKEPICFKAVTVISTKKKLGLASEQCLLFYSIMLPTIDTDM